VSAPRTILIMAAGTGGHIFPGLAIAKELELRGWNVHWMGTPWGMENQIVTDVGYPIVTINISGVRGKGIAAWFFLPFRILIGFLQSTIAIFRIRPDVVLSLGGYVAFPGGMMAALWGRPLVVHEPGAVAGITNRLLAAVADRVIVGMEGAFDRNVATRWANRIPKPKRVDWLGTPVREEISQVPPPDERFAGRSGALRLLVVGGSLGAQTMNDLVLAALASMPADKRPQVVHQAGQKLHEKLEYAYRHAHVEAEVVPFIDDMARRYAWCDRRRGRGLDPFPVAVVRGRRADRERALPLRPRRGDHARATRNKTGTARGDPAWPRSKPFIPHGASSARARETRRDACMRRCLRGACPCGIRSSASTSSASAARACPGSPRCSATSATP